MGAQVIPPAASPSSLCAHLSVPGPQYRGDPNQSRILPVLRGSGCDPDLYEYTPWPPSMAQCILRGLTIPQRARPLIRIAHLPTSAPGWSDAFERQYHQRLPCS